MFQAWGLTSDEGTIIWGLDTTHRGENIDVIRARRTLRDSVSLQLNGLAPGEYEVRPFDTWTGNNLPAYPFICSNDSQGCTLELPAFTSDIALKLHPL